MEVKISTLPWERISSGSEIIYRNVIQYEVLSGVIIILRLEFGN